MAAPKTNRRAIARGAGGKPMSRQGRDPVSGKKVFGREFNSGKAAGVAGAKGPRFARAVSGMQARLARMDAGKLQGKPGERSFMRGFLASPAARALTRKAAPPGVASSSPSPGGKGKR